MRGRLKKKKSLSLGMHYIITKTGKFYPIRIWLPNNKLRHKALLKWAKASESKHRIVARDTVSPEVWVSTVFLGFDHSFMRNGPPLLFETMIFGGKYHHYQNRYTTRKKALKGHREAVAIARGERNKDTLMVTG